MKKFTFAKIASLVFVCAMLFCALAVTTLAADEPTVEIVSNNVYYGEKYQLMFAVNAPEGATVNATVNGTAVDVELFSTNPTDDEGNVVADYAYILADGVAAQAIDAVVTFTVTANGETAATQYSVLQYIYERTHVSENKAEGTELAMFEALVAYADAANTHFKGATVSFNDYVYVTAEGVTVNGVNPTGMYKAGDMPFANAELALDFDSATEVEKWYIDGEDVSLENVKAIVVADKNIEVVAKVLPKCFDGHTWIDATCTEPKTCESCGETEGDPAGHVDEDANYYCDECGELVLPEDGTELSIAEASKIAAIAGDAYTTNKYIVTGVITSVANTTYGNVYIKDASGNEFYVYGINDEDGNKYGEMADKPVVGEQITVYGVLGTYNGNVIQMKSSTLLAVEEHTHVFGDATCTAPAACYCGAVDGKSLGHIDEDEDVVCDRCGDDMPSGEAVWTLVTDMSQIKVGSQVIIVAKNANYAMSTTQNTNNRAHTAVTKNGNFLEDVSETVQILTVGEGKTAGTYSLSTGNGYLYAASSSKNYLKTETTLSANSSWDITVTAAGVATIKSTGSNTRNWLRYNSSNNPPIFACYGSGQTDVCIYVLQ